jgi:hypothetical protein
VKFEAVVLMGVPLSRPLELFKIRPDGREPVIIEKVKGAEPTLGLNVVLKRLPTVAVGSVTGFRAITEQEAEIV